MKVNEKVPAMGPIAAWPELFQNIDAGGVAAGFGPDAGSMSRAVVGAGVGELMSAAARDRVGHRTCVRPRAGGDAVCIDVMEHVKNEDSNVRARAFA